MRTHLAAMGIALAGIVLGVLLALFVSIKVGIAVGVVIIGIGGGLALINMARIFRGRPKPPRAMGPHWPTNSDCW